MSTRKVNATISASTIKGVVEKHGSPVLILSRSKLVANYRKFHKLLPRVKVFYAVKANPHPDVVKAFLAEGLNFDVASRSEIELTLSLGAKPEQLVFANTVKNPEALALASRKGVHLMTFDSEYELIKIRKLCPKARLLVRIKVPNVGSLVELSLKFGCEVSDAVPLMLKAQSMGLQCVGVSFHVGSQCRQVENFIDAFDMVSMILNEARQKGLNLDTVDIGGGFPTDVNGEGEYAVFTRMTSVLAKELDRVFPKEVKIIAEPGRILVASAATLAARVVGKAIRENKHWYYLDDGIYGTLSGIVFDHAQYKFHTLRRGNPLISTLAGPTCDSLDIITRSVDLPYLYMDDIVYVNNIGAYSTGTATHFNGISPAKVVAIP